MKKEENKTRKSRLVLCIELLNTFSKKEVEHLKDLIACRYFNTDRYVVKLLDVLRKSVLNKRTFTEEIECSIYRKVFNDLPAPKHILNKKQKGLLNAKMNVLLRLAEQFLSIKTMKTHDIHKCELLYPELIERNQYLLFNRHINKDRKQIDEQVAKGKDVYVQSQRIEENILNYHYRVGSITKENNLPDLIYNLDVSYLLNRLAHYATMLSLRIASQEEGYDFSSIKLLAEFMDSPQYAKHPHIILYRSIIKLMEMPEDKAYYDLLNLLDRHSEVTPYDMLKSFYEVAINYCVSKMWTDRTAYAQKMFDLYNIMHHKNLLVENGFIAINWLKNMIGIGCFAEEFEWTEMMIEYYRPYVREGVRDSVCHFNYGAIAFHQKDYEVAHDRFIQVGKVNLNYDTNTRVLILKCLYEKENEYSEYTMTTFRSADRFFNLNKQLPQRRKMGYRNFIIILMTLYRIRHREGTRTLSWVEGQLEQQEVNSDKRWLLEKIEELKGRKQRSW